MKKVNWLDLSPDEFVDRHGNRLKRVDLFFVGYCLCLFFMIFLTRVLDYGRMGSKIISSKGACREI